MEEDKRIQVPSDMPDDETLLALSSKAFMGSFPHSLDNKSRLIVPAAFRTQLGERFFIGPSFNFKSIALYPALVWARLREGYARMGAYDSRLNRYLEQFDALSYRDQECDAQGRVLLPSRIRQRILGDEKEVEISGSYDHVRISARPKAEQEFEDFMNDLPDIMDAINGISRGL